jgi:hypothetical protein
MAGTLIMEITTIVIIHTTKVEEVPHTLILQTQTENLLQETILKTERVLVGLQILLITVEALSTIIRQEPAQLLREEVNLKIHPIIPRHQGLIRTLVDK